ncbi:MAG: sugar phosphate isomerase/epimerase [Bryobacteraceae bacterium]|nr:sugar phosphate isomerase/epimerase [Bryobacteraceae bacterium]
MTERMSRRRALSVCAAAPVAGAGQRPPLLLGAPLFLRSEDPRELAREARRLGYSAAYCPPATPQDTGRLRAIEAGFAAERVVLAEVGVWVNLMDADAGRRRENLQKVTEGLAVAEAVGARCAVTICGSFNEKVWYGPHPKNLGQEFFDAAVENARKIIDAVKPRRTKFTYEMMGWSLPDSPDAYLKMIRAIDRPAFAVHLDVCNLVNSPLRFYQNGALIEECFRKLGRWIASCHAKDLDWIPEMNIHFVEVIPGRGQIDYRALLRGLASLPSPPPLMLEHLRTAEEYAEGAGFIRRTAAGLGLEFA